MPIVELEHHKAGDFFVDFEEKVFEDVKAEPGEKALVTFHTVAFEGSIGFVNLLQALRLLRKGFETSILLYGPGVTLGVQRGFPKIGDEAFPGHQNFNNQLKKLWTKAVRCTAAASRCKPFTATANRRRDEPQSGAVGSQTGGVSILIDHCGRLSSKAASCATIPQRYRRKK